MKCIPLLIISLMLSQSLSAQIWTQINSSTDRDIRSCSFIDQDNGWIVHGTDSPTLVDSIYRTNDGGNSWINQNYPPDPPSNTRFFNRIHFINENVGIIACGNYLYAGHDPSLVSSILWTNDGGETWTVSGSSNFASDACLTSPTSAYLISQYGQCSKTTDAGQTWSAANFQGGGYSGTRLFPISEDTVYFAGLDNLNLIGAFGRTYTGGVPWEVYTVSQNTVMYAIHFNDHLHGWIGGSDGEILYTNDGGDNWISCNTGMTSNIRALTFIDALNGWAVTSDGKIINSIDGGLNWNIEYDGDIQLWDIQFPGSGEIGYAVGADGLILKYSLTVDILDAPQIGTLNIHPNPMIMRSTISTSHLPGNSSLTLFNMLGEPVRHIDQLDHKNIVLERDGLANGLYLVKLMHNNRAFTVGKLLISDE